MRLPLSLVCALVALGVARPAAALDLYAAQAPLVDATDAGRDAAAALAFGSVLGQVTGHPATAALARQPAGRTAATKALLGFTSKTAPDGSPAIEARFDPAAVRSFLAAQGVAMLPDQRPTLLLWLVVDGPTPTWLGADEPPDVAAALMQSAAAHGLPVLLPVLDLDERRNLPAALDPAQPASVAALGTASAHYRPDGVLFARLRGDARRWQLDARATLPGHEDAVWSARGDSVQAAIATALDHVTTLLASAVVAPQGPPAPTQITVTGIDDVAGYGRVWDHLAHVPGLKGLRPVALGGGRAVFGFDLPGGATGLPTLVEPGAPFTPAARTGDSPDYRYQP
jgi:hypothetical protein